MKNLKLFLIAQCLIFFAFNASAHKPDLSSTILVEESDNVWKLQVRAALTAFEYEVESRFGKGAYATPEEFMDLVKKHVQESLSIHFDKSELKLANGIVRLGHETQVTFQVEGATSTFKTVQLRNTSFKDISRNQSALMVLKKGFTKNQFTLDKNNNHTVVLKAGKSSFDLETPSVANSQFPLTSMVWVSAGVMILLLVYRGWSNAKSSYSK